MSLFTPLAALLLLLAAQGEAPVSSPTSTPAPDEAAVAAAMAVPLDFLLPKKESEAAWQRAFLWLSQHSAMPVASVTGQYIGTEPPPPGEGKIGFYVTRATLEDKRVEISVHATGVHADWSGSPGDLAAHALAAFIKNGSPTTASP